MYTTKTFSLIRGAKKIKKLKTQHAAGGAAALSKSAKEPPAKTNLKTEASKKGDGPTLGGKVQQVGGVKARPRRKLGKGWDNQSVAKGPIL